MSMYPPQPPLGTGWPGQPGQHARPPRKKAVWPIVIGIICILFGALGSCCNIFTFLVEIPDDISAASGMTQERMDRYERWELMALPGRLADVACYVLLVAIGIAMIRRWPGVRSAALWWAVIRFPVVIVSRLIALPARLAVTGVAAGSGDVAQGAPVNPYWFGGCMAEMVFVLALPVFLLIWFNAQGVCSEVESWDDQEMLPG